MTGYLDDNRPAFNRAAEELRATGLFDEVINPADLDLSDPTPCKVRTDYYRRDLPHVARCSVGIALPGWQRSPGAVNEAVNLSHLGCQILRYPDLTPIPDRDLPYVVVPGIEQHEFHPIGAC